MGYEAKWSNRAERELDQYELTDVETCALEEAIRRVEAALAKDPRAVGVMQLVSTRMLTDAPLGIVYDIIEADKIVIISSAWFFK